MRNLVALILVVSLAVETIIIIKHDSKSKPRLISNSQLIQGLSFEKVTPHSNQEVINAQCPKEVDLQWKLGKPIDCETSSDGKFLAKFFYNGLSTPDSYYELFVINIKDKSVKRIWAGDFRTLGWDWKKDNKIEVRYNCGTGCQAIKTMNTNESATIADYKNGKMNEKNGWRIEFAK